MSPYSTGCDRGDRYDPPGHRISADTASANMSSVVEHNPMISVVYYHIRDDEAKDTNMGRYHKVVCKGCGSMWTHIPGRGVALYVLRYHTMYPDVEDIPWPPTLLALLSQTMLNENVVAGIPRKNWTKRLRRFSGSKG